jgi:hypothetical protein
MINKGIIMKPPQTGFQKWNLSLQPLWQVGLALALVLLFLSPSRAGAQDGFVLFSEDFADEPLNQVFDRPNDWWAPNWMAAAQDVVSFADADGPDGLVAVTRALTANLTLEEPYYGGGLRGPVVPIPQIDESAVDPAEVKISFWAKGQSNGDIGTVGFSIIGFAQNEDGSTAVASAAYVKQQLTDEWAQYTISLDQMEAGIPGHGTEGSALDLGSVSFQVFAWMRADQETGWPVNEGDSHSFSLAHITVTISGEVTLDPVPETILYADDFATEPLDVVFERSNNWWAPNWMAAAQDVVSSAATNGPDGAVAITRSLTANLTLDDPYYGGGLRGPVVEIPQIDAARVDPANVVLRFWAKGSSTGPIGTIGFSIIGFDVDAEGGQSATSAAYIQQQLTEEWTQYTYTLEELTAGIPGHGTEGNALDIGADKVQGFIWMRGGIETGWNVDAGDAHSFSISSIELLITEEVFPAPGPSLELYSEDFAEEPLDVVFERANNWWAPNWMAAAQDVVSSASTDGPGGSVAVTRALTANLTLDEPYYGGGLRGPVVPIPQIDESLVNPRNVTVSFWAKGASNGPIGTIGFSLIGFEPNDEGASSPLSAAYVQVQLTEEWRQFTYTLAQMQAGIPGHGTEGTALNLGSTAVQGFVWMRGGIENGWNVDAGDSHSFSIAGLEVTVNQEVVFDPVAYPLYEEDFSTVEQGITFERANDWWAPNWMAAAQDVASSASTDGPDGAVAVTRSLNANLTLDDPYYGGGLRGPVVPIGEFGEFEFYPANGTVSFWAKATSNGPIGTIGFSLISFIANEDASTTVNGAAYVQVQLTDEWTQYTYNVAEMRMGIPGHGTDGKPFDFTADSVQAFIWMRGGIETGWNVDAGAAHSFSIAGIQMTLQDGDPLPLWDFVDSTDGWKHTQLGWIWDETYPYIFSLSWYLDTAPDPLAGWLYVDPAGYLDTLRVYSFADQDWYFSTQSLPGWVYALSVQPEAAFLVEDFSTLPLDTELTRQDPWWGPNWMAAAQTVVSTATADGPDGAIAVTRSLDATMTLDDPYYGGGLRGPVVDWPELDPEITDVDIEVSFWAKGTFTSEIGEIGFSLLSFDRNPEGANTVTGAAYARPELTGEWTRYRYSLGYMRMGVPGHDSDQLPFDLNADAAQFFIWMRKGFEEGWPVSEGDSSAFSVANIQLRIFPNGWFQLD